MVGIYHIMYPEDDFNTTSKTLVSLINKAQQKYPNQPRSLRISIIDHRNEDGEFDREAFLLQNEFAIKFLLPYVAELNMPIANIINKEKQKKDIPDSL